MHRLLRYAAVMTTALFLSASATAAEKTQQLFLRATAPNGAPVTDLQASDVKVMEDGVACKVVKVEPAGPTKVQVLVDNGEIITNPINGLREGLQAFFQKLPEGVEVSLYTTAPQGRAVVKNVTDRKKLVDAIAVIAPDRGTGAFFESLLDAVDRVDHDKAPGFPTIVMVGSDVGVETIRDRDIPDIQQKIIRDGILIDVVLMLGGTNRSSGVGSQPEIGMVVTKLSGGRYDSINSTTRLATLLPEVGDQIAQIAAKQRNQYRVTYEPVSKRGTSPKVGVSVTRDATVSISRDGR
jgi:hypothetical protein